MDGATANPISSIPDLVSVDTVLQYCFVLSCFLLSYSVCPSDFHNAEECLKRLYDKMIRIR